MKVGFIGLGRMGQGMARNLLKGGASLVVYDTNAEAVANLVADGAAACASIAKLVAEVEVVFTSLPGPAQVEAVVCGPGGIVENMRPGLVLFDLSTSSLTLNRRLEEAFRAKGGCMLDAPVSGGPQGAASGDLAIWVSGDRAAYDRHETLLKMMGDKASYVGAIGTATVAKLAQNLSAFMIWQTMAEVFSMGVKAGVEPLALWEALRLGSVGRQSPLMLLVNQFMPGKYEPAAFALNLAYKDMKLAMDLCHELGIPMRLASLTMDEMTEARARGWGEQDARAMLKLQLERAGVEIAVDPQRMKDAVNRK